MSAAREAVVVAAGLAAAALGFVWLSAGLGPVARVAPLAVGVPTAALLLIQLTLDLRRARPATPESQVSSVEALRLLAWLPALLFVVLAAGIVVGLPLWLAAFLRWRARESWPVTLAFAAMLLMMLWLVVVVIIDADLTAGGVIPLGS